MKSLALLCAATIFFCASSVLAKRPAPRDVPPVKSASAAIEYRFPPQHMGCVEAFDTKTGELLWRRQVYVVRFTPNLEKDVQDVFVASVEIKDKTMILTNERNSQYQLDLDTLEVKVLKGSLVENRK